MTLSEYENRVLHQMELDLQATGRPHTFRLIELVTQLWPLLACTAAAVPVCLVVLLVAPPVERIVSTVSAALVLGVLWTTRWRQLRSRGARTSGA